MNFLSMSSLIWSYAPDPLSIIKSDCNIFFLIAITAKVLRTDVFSSDGNKSSTNSLRFCFSSSDIEESFLINSRAEDEFEYFIESSFIALLTEFISELVISANDFLGTGLPFRYKTASIFVIKSSSASFVLFELDWLMTKYLKSLLR